MIETVLVVLPARDEEDLIGRSLDAVLHSADHLAQARPDVRTVVVAVLDRCVDGTERIARSVLAGRADTAVVVSDAGAVGAARASGISAGLRRLGVDPAEAHGVWLANTDADSVVPPNWLLDQVERGEAGADVVVGTVHPDPDELDPDLYRGWLSTKVVGRPNGLVHGANLGVRATAYEEAGGFAPVGLHEDNDLVDRLRGLDATIVASDGGEVLTSARRDNRVDGGYAGFLHRELRPLCRP